MTTSIKIWKPYQIFVATYIGGPIGGCYLLYENFRALEEPAKGRFALLFGLFLFAASFLYFTLPVEIISRIPGFLVTLTLVLFIQSYSRFSQEAAIATLEEAGALRHSYKRLFGIAILALFLQWAIAFGIAILL